MLVLDSGSTDETTTIAGAFSNVVVIHRTFDTFADQCNFGLSQIDTEWVLSFDADYVAEEAFETQAVNSLSKSDPVAGYRAAFRYCINGRRLSGTLYPPRTVLYRRAAAHYENEGHGHRVRVQGHVADLGASVDHDDRKPLTRWLTSQVKYAEAEAAFLVEASASTLGQIDKLRARGWLLPFLAPVYCLIVKGLWRDGLAGWHYTLQRWLAECMIALAVVDRRLAGPKSRK